MMVVYRLLYIIEIVVQSELVLVAAQNKFELYWINHTLQCATFNLFSCLLK